MSVQTSLAVLKETLSGFILYHFFKRKKIVIVLSAMRSGSTLLKALLSQAPEIDHLNEVNFSRGENKYMVYNAFYKLSRKEVLLLKKPSGLRSFQDYPQLPNLPLSVIVLIRNPVDTILSTIEMQKSRNREERDLNTIMTYWSVTYNNLLCYLDQEENSSVVIKYEELVDSPIETTEILFKFIGSKRTEGVKSYQKPLSGDWSWGLDDGGDKINSMSVVNVKKDYTEYMDEVSVILGNEAILDTSNSYNLNLPPVST